MNQDYARLRELSESDPVAFRKLMEAVAAKVVSLHPAQQEVYSSDARFKVLNAGRRTGKTVLAARSALTVCRRPKRMAWWIAPTYKVVKRGYAEVLRQLPDGVLEKPAPPDSHFDAGRSVILRFKNGSRMEFYSAERPEGMLGEGVDFAVLDEAAIMPPRIWEQTVSPTLMDRAGGGLMISTPRGRNWFYRVYRLGQDPEINEWASWTFPTSSNPYIPPEEIEQLRNTLPSLIFDQEVLAKFLAAGSSVFMLHENAIQHGRVYDNGLIENALPQGHVTLGIDLAQTTDWTVLYGARSSDRKNCYFERFNQISWSEQRRRIARAVRLLHENGATGVTLVIDEGNAGKPIVEALEEAGYDVIPINFTTHKTNMVKLLAKDLEGKRPRAYVLDNAMREEFEAYAMSITPAGRYTFSAPSGEHDDVVSAKMLSHWGMVNEGVPGITTLSADDLDVPVADAEADEWVAEFDEDTPEAHGLPSRLPTPAELMARPEVWLGR